MLNPKLGTSQTLNLHGNDFSSADTWNEIVKRDPTSSRHIPGIHPSLARIYLWDIKKNGSLPSRIIVGQHGDDSLKNAVRDTLSLIDGVEVSIYASNPGILNVAKA